MYNRVFTWARPLGTVHKPCSGVLGAMARGSVWSMGQRSVNMSAWQVYEYGGVDKLQYNSKIVRPHVKKTDDVLVEVHAASVNPIDMMMLGGFGSQTLPKVQRLTAFDWSKPELPKTLGEDFSGVVVDVGKKAQREYKAGDQVWGVVSPVLSAQGTHAEYVVTSSQCLAHKPHTLTHVQAASVPYVLCTVVSALGVFANLNKQKLRSKRVLVVGASGGIGTFASQMLSLWGAEVTAVCSAEAADLVTSLGATTVIDYKTQDVPSELRHMEPFHVVLDCITKEDSQLDQWMNLLYPRQQAHYLRLASPFLENNDKYGILQGLMTSTSDVVCKALKYSRGEGKHYRWAFFTPRPNELRSFAKDFNDKLIKPVIDSVFPFSSVPEAFQKLESGHSRGKVVIQIKS